MPLAEIVAVSEGLDGAVALFQVHRGEGDEAMSVQDKRSPIVDDHLLAGL